MTTTSPLRLRFQVIVSGLIKLATSRGQVPTISFNDVNQRVGYTELINFEMS